MKNAPSVFDLLKPAPYQHLKSLFAKFDINIDPKILILKNQSKETILQNILTDLENAPKIINFSQRSSHYIADNEVKEILSHEQNLKNLRVSNIIRCLLVDSLVEKVIADFVHKEQMKAIQRRLHEILVRMIGAEYFRQLLISEAEKMKIQQLNEEMEKIMRNEITSSYDKTFKDLCEIREKIEHCNERLIQCREEKEELKKELKSESNEVAHQIISEYRDRQTGENPFKEVNEDLLGEVIDQFQRKMGKAEWDLEVLKEKDEKAIKKEEGSREREKDLDAQLKVLAEKERELRYTASGYPRSKQAMVRVPSVESNLIEEERMAIKAELVLIQEKRKLRNEKIAARENMRYRIQTDFFDILPKTIKEKNDPSLNKLLDDKRAMDHLYMSASFKISEIVEDYKKKKSENREIEKEKKTHLYKADQEMNKDLKRMENYLSLSLQKGGNVEILSKRDKNMALHNEIHQVAAKTLTPKLDISFKPRNVP